MSTYVCIGNTDNILTQLEWAKFQDELLVLFEDQMRQDIISLHGVWYSAPNSEFQNMCLCFDIQEDQPLADKILKEVLRGLADAYRQDSITWAEAKTTFLTPQ